MYVCMYVFTYDMYTYEYICIYYKNILYMYVYIYAIMKTLGYCFLATHALGHMS